MSADVRALLKAKTQERAKRIVHPLAAYNASGQLRCTLCATIVKDNEISWSGHLGSKAHRTNVGRQKELAKKEEERARLEKGKRKAASEEEGSGSGSGSNDEDEDMDTGHLRAGQGSATGSKRQKTEEEQRPSAAISSNFFSDPTRTLPTGNDEDDEEDANVTRTKPTRPAPTNAPPKLSQIDLEWAQFERDVLAKPAQSSSNPDNPPLSKKEIYDRATVVMEEEVRYDLNGDGFPDHLQSNADGNATRGGGGGAAGVDGEYVGGVPIEDESPEQVAARKAQEEKELIMDRILDEERAQEDADEKVRAIKARLALVRKKREEEKKRKAAAGGS